MAAAVGFTRQEQEEIALAASELATNLVKHAGGGEIQFRSIRSGDKPGLQIVSEDCGPGIADINRALTDGCSTSGSLGVGLGSVNRLMDELEFCAQEGGGLRVTTRRWLRPPVGSATQRWIEFGAATRSCRYQAENGDALTVRQWEDDALAALIDGLGHGAPAQRAASAAREYLDHHFDQPLANLFLGVSRACRATRGVVMALARFHKSSDFTYASVGNIEARLIGASVRFAPVLRRGIIGLVNAPAPVPKEYSWSRGSLFIMHSDGVSSRWATANIPDLADKPAGVVAQDLLARYGRTEDDATVLVARNLNG